ncbi:hypothetical protein J4E91_010342 [Alternaria rosae]|nr:hypothetical protein J4E91_010342 [Alternaria rosae]
MAASKHQSAALTGLNQAVANIGPLNCHAIFAAASMTVINAFADARAYNLDVLVEILQLARGMDYVLTSVTDMLRKGPFAAIVRPAEEMPKPPSLLSAFLVDIQALSCPTSANPSPDDINAARAAEVLRNGLQYSLETSTHPALRATMIWPIAVAPEFIEALKSRTHPGARAIFKHYCQLMDPEEEEAEDYEDEDDDADWRGKLPTGIFDANSAWWDELQGDEPMTILKWAEALEQRKLNVSYLKAYENFEYWRRKHIERYEEEDRIQQDINALPERLQVHVRRSLEAKRAESKYCYEQYQEDHDDEQYFWEQEALEDPDSIPMPTDTWRYRHNAVESSATPQQHLANFRIQCKAVEQRNIGWIEQGIEYYPQAEMDCRARRRKETEARLLEEVARAEKAACERKLINDMNSAKRVGRLAKASATELMDEVTPRCLEDGPQDDAIPYSLEDGAKDWAA